MKATIDGVPVEGTPEEIDQLMRAVKARAFARPIVAAIAPSGVDRHPYVNEDTAFRALKRRPLSPEQKIFLKKLASEYPNWTLASELQRITKYTKPQFSGLLGAFGKRVASTEGYVSGTWFYDGKWNYDDDCNQYRLPEHLVEVVNRAIK